MKFAWYLKNTLTIFLFSSLFLYTTAWLKRLPKTNLPINLFLATCVWWDYINKHFHCTRKNSKTQEFLWAVYGYIFNTYLLQSQKKNETSADRRNNNFLAKAIQYKGKLRIAGTIGQHKFWRYGILLCTKIVLTYCEKNCYSNSGRSEQFLVTECFFFNLFLEVSHI